MAENGRDLFSAKILNFYMKPGCKGGVKHLPWLDSETMVFCAKKCS